MQCPDLAIPDFAIPDLSMPRSPFPSLSIDVGTRSLPKTLPYSATTATSFRKSKFHLKTGQANLTTAAVAVFGKRKHLQIAPALVTKTYKRPRLVHTHTKSVGPGSQTCCSSGDAKIKNDAPSIISSHTMKLTAHGS